jgi:hypothetical protein
MLQELGENVRRSGDRGRETIPVAFNPRRAIRVHILLFTVNAINLNADKDATTRIGSKDRYDENGERLTPGPREVVESCVWWNSVVG